MRTRPVAWSPTRNKDELERLYRRIIPQLRRVAKQAGYGLGVHGSLRRDLDLIAVPWVKCALAPNTLAARMQTAMCGSQQPRYEWEQKPETPRPSWCPDLSELLK